jgi:hypothetical protein
VTEAPRAILVRGPRGGVRATQDQGGVGGLLQHGVGEAAISCAKAAKARFSAAWSGRREGGRHGSTVELTDPGSDAAWGETTEGRCQKNYAIVPVGTAFSRACHAGILRCWNLTYKPSIFLSEST